jgi:hypothetical protein
MISDYNALQLHENENQIAIDFDGVIHLNSKGFYDGTIYDNPVPGAVESIKYLADSGYNIIIYTAKAKPDRPLINNKCGVDLIKEWLEKYGLLEYISDITAEKPRAKFYIDDKAITFTNWVDVLKIIK